MQHTSQPEVLVSPGDLTLPHCPPSASQRCSRLPLGQEMRKYLMFSDFTDPDYGQRDTDPDYGQHDTDPDCGQHDTDPDNGQHENEIDEEKD